MTEDFLQFIWEQRLFDTENIKSTDGERIEVLDPGVRNTDSGPDFFNAKVRIDDTLWVGNIEIHRMASDWLKHRHQADYAYDSIILHVVDSFDQDVFRKSGNKIPAMVLNYSPVLLENYRSLLNSKAWIPCQSRFLSIDPIVLRIGFNRLLVERLQEKTGEIMEKLHQNQRNWNETFYQFLARNFGFKTNAMPFELMAKSLPMNILGKHKDNPFQIEALLFGQSGLLSELLWADDYYFELRKEYEFLMKKYSLKPIPGHLWKYLRLRPVNFPTIRIAQFAALIYRSSGLFSKITETGSLNELKGMFNVKASPYWDTHYKFGLVSRETSKNLGNSATENIIINTVIPFLFVYGEQNNKHHLKENAIEWLEHLSPETNSVISGWQKLDVRPHSAFDTQALIQLKTRYCSARKCLKCHVGNKLIRM